jgi:hypothetical protein
LRVENGQSGCNRRRKRRIFDHFFEKTKPICSILSIAERRLKKQSQSGDGPDGRNLINEKGLWKAPLISRAKKQSQSKPNTTLDLAQELPEHVDWWPLRILP